MWRAIVDQSGGHIRPAWLAKGRLGRGCCWVLNELSLG
jgi:hypothetical protein